MMWMIGWGDIAQTTIIIVDYQETISYVVLLLKGRIQDQSPWVPQQLINSLFIHDFVLLSSFLVAVVDLVVVAVVVVVVTLYKYLLY